MKECRSLLEFTSVLLEYMVSLSLLFDHFYYNIVIQSLLKFRNDEVVVMSFTFLFHILSIVVKIDTREKWTQYNSNHLRGSLVSSAVFLAEYLHCVPWEATDMDRRADF